MNYRCLLFLVMFFSSFSRSLSRTNVVTARFYKPPYVPTACYGSSESDFPANHQFAAADEGTWNNGAACGRVYRVRCVSAAGLKGACIPGSSVYVQIVDRATNVAHPSTNSATTLLLNEIAFRMIAAPGATEVEVELLQ